MTSSTWTALAHLTALLSTVAAEAPKPSRAILRRVDALERAVAERDLPRLLSVNGDDPPREVDAYWDDRVAAADLPEVAVWLAEHAFSRLARGESAHLQPVLLAVEEWGKVAARTA